MIASFGLRTNIDGDDRKSTQRTDIDGDDRKSTPIKSSNEKLPDTNSPDNE
jgi:hypothetical protein